MSIRPILGVLAVAVLAGGVVTIAVAKPSHPTSSHAARTVPRPPTTGHPSSADPDSSGEVRRPTAGTYRYVSDGTTTSWGKGIRPRPSPAGTLVDEIVTTTGIHQIVQYTPDALLELAYSQTGTSVESEIKCEEQAPLTILQLPLAPDATWTSTVTCANLLGDQVAVTRVTRVTGVTNQTVGATAIPVWELVTVTRQRTAKTSSTTTVTQDISARYGLVVREVTQEGTDQQTIRTDRLVSLQPA